MKIEKNSERLPGWFYISCLVFVILIWGSMPVINRKIIYEYFSPTVYNAMVGLISATALFLISHKELQKLSKSILKVSIPTGIINASAAMLQKIGLKYSTPSKCAFLDTLSCIVVPILMFILTKKKPSVFKVIAAATCLVGCFILTNGDVSGGFGGGEILCSLAGILYGVNIALTSLWSKDVYPPIHVMVHMVIQFISCSIMSIILNFVNIGGNIAEPLKLEFGIIPVVTLLFSALVATTLGWVIRINVIKNIDATVVAVMMPLSAVVTSVVSVIVGTDLLTSNLLIGGILVVSASIISNLGKSHAPKTDVNRNDLSEATSYD